MGSLYKKSLLLLIGTVEILLTLMIANSNGAQNVEQTIPELMMDTTTSLDPQQQDESLRLQGKGSEEKEKIHKEDSKSLESAISQAKEDQGDQDAITIKRQKKMLKRDDNDYSHLNEQQQGSNDNDEDDVLRRTTGGEKLLRKNDLLLAALRFDTLFKYMTDLQIKFLLAILPEAWTVPKFISDSNTDLKELQSALRLLTDRLGAPSIAAALAELAYHDGPDSELLQYLPIVTKPIFKLFLAASTGASFKDLPYSLHHNIPNLDLLDLNEIARVFKIPAELEWPVNSGNLSLFLPVMVPNFSDGPFGQNDVSTVTENIQRIRIPVADHQGELLFADARSVLQGIALPDTLDLTPLAFFSSLEIEDINNLWSLIKVPVLSKLSLLGANAHALFGPVMTLASLPRLALSINGESLLPGGSTNQLARIVGDVSSQLRKGLRSFSDLAISDTVAPSTKALLREPLEEFLNLRFLNYSIPVVGVAKELEIGVFTPFHLLPKCSAQDCPLGLPIPSFPEFLVSPEASITKLQARVETLSAELQAAVIELQAKIHSILPEGISTAVDTSGMSLDEALKTAVKLTSTLQAAVTVSKEKVNRFFGEVSTQATQAAAAEAASLTKSFLETLEIPKNLYSSVIGSLQHIGKDHGQEEGLLARRRRRLQGGSFLELPALALGLDMKRLEIPGQASLEELLSLRQLTSAVENIVPTEGSPLIQILSPSHIGHSLGELFKENALPDALLQQPVDRIFEGAAALPASLLRLNLGQFLSLSTSLDKIFASPLTAIPNLRELSLNPAVLLSLTPGVEAIEKLFGSGSDAIHQLAGGRTPLAPSALGVPSTEGLFF